jgi:uncharacterized membrane protein YebE (DUF533 family)
MAGFTDILGALIQQGMSQSGPSRAGNALGGGGSDSGSLSDLLGSLGNMTGGSQSGNRPEASGGGGSLSDLFGSLGKMAGGSTSGNTQEAGGGGSLGDLLGSLGKMAGGSQSGNADPQGQQTGVGGALGDLLSNLGNNKAALGGLGALAGALLGGGGKSVGGAVGGGALAMLASMAMSALKNSGQAPSRPPNALIEPQTHEDELALENDAEIIVKAMISAAKADGKIDNAEIQKIIGKLDDDGLTQEEKDFFISEANKPLNLDGVIASAGNKPEMAAQIYAASLLAIDVNTAAEQRYMQQLASGLGLHPQVTAHIERTLGIA